MSIGAVPGYYLAGGGILIKRMFFPEVSAGELAEHGLNSWFTLVYFRFGHHDRLPRGQILRNMGRFSDNHNGDFDQHGVHGKNKACIRPKR